MTTLVLTVEIPEQREAAFRSAMTGNDRDIILAAERAMNDKLGITHEPEKIELWPEKWPGTI